MNDAALRIITVIAITGAIAQLAYGVLAIAFPWPQIVSTGGEWLWIAANVGMLAGYVGWAAVVARGRTVAAGVAIAGTGFVLRITAAIITIVSPLAVVLPFVLGSIVLTLAGVAIVAVGTLRVRGARSWEAWVPAVAALAELGLASMYTIDTPLHFVLLGLLWGTVSLVVGLIVASRALAVSGAGHRALNPPAS